MADPYFSNVVLLLHMDGTNGSSTFTDFSKIPKTITRTGTVALSTTGPKFGSAAAAFDGSVTAIDIVHHAAFDLGALDFTIESWVYIDSTATQTAILYNKRDVTNNPYQAQIRLVRNSSSDWRLGYYGYPSGGVQHFGVSAISLPLNTWTHVAVTKQGVTVRLFIDGILDSNVVTLSDATLTPDGGWPVSIGAYNGGSFSLKGMLDEFRVTTGVARYTASFTLPTEPFPHSTELGVVGKVYFSSTPWLSGDARPVRNWRLKPPTISFLAGPQCYSSALGEWIKQIKGTVRDSGGAPVARTVLALDSRTHNLINRARSNPTTGAFSIGVPNVSSVVVIALPDPGDTANAVVAWKVVPIDLY